MIDDGTVFEELRGDAKFTTENTAFYLEDTEINHNLLGSFEQIRLNFVVGIVFLPQCSQRFHKGAH
ncbi:hypothetical protein CDW55_11085 [Chryseobacterium sp. VAUSW3]|nr:hypothetical protein CDW55_11085 [Chryseobacterium sp. VAUSW3]